MRHKNTAPGCVSHCKDSNFMGDSLTSLMHSRNSAPDVLLVPVLGFLFFFGFSTGIYTPSLHLESLHQPCFFVKGFSR
jgi:hypothetical protein